MTLLATTDVHGNVMDWDYFCNRPASELYGTGIGLARAAGIVAQVRQRCGPDSVVLVDNGDTLQGTPVAYYYARVEPRIPCCTTAQRPSPVTKNAWW